MPDPEDPVAQLLALSVAERIALVERLADSLAAEPDGVQKLRRLRTLLDRRVRAQTQRDRPSRGFQSR
jgi:putative addiction module component (TIGR02574 family)